MKSIPNVMYLNEWHDSHIQYQGSNDKVSFPVFGKINDDREIMIATWFSFYLLFSKTILWVKRKRAWEKITTELQKRKPILH